MELLLLQTRHSAKCNFWGKAYVAFSRGDVHSTSMLGSKGKCLQEDTMTVLTMKSGIEKFTITFVLLVI